MRSKGLDIITSNPKIHLHIHIHKHTYVLIQIHIHILTNSIIHFSCGGLVALLPRIIIFAFYQLQFGKVVLFLVLDPALRIETAK